MKYVSTFVLVLSLIPASSFAGNQKSYLCIEEHSAGLRYDRVGGWDAKVFGATGKYIIRPLMMMILNG